MLQFLKPPRFKDEDQTRESHALHIILWTTIAVATLLSIAIFLLPDFLVRWLVIIGVAYALCISMLILNHRGYTRSASVILIAGLWALVSAAAFTGGGIAAPGTYFYLIIIFVAGFLRGPKAGVVTALVCTLTALSFVIIETNGYLLSPVVPHTPLTRWISLTLLVIFMVTLQYIAAMTIRGSMQRIREELVERMRSEEALRESQARLKLAIEASNTGLWDWDIRTNQVYFSPEWKKQIGFEDNELPNAFEEWERRLHPEDHDMTVKKLQWFLHDPATSFENEFRLHHKDGSYRWIYTHARVIRDDKKQPVRMLGSHVDITERKQAEEAIRVSEARFRALIENSDDIVLVLNPDGVVSYASPSASRIMGHPPSSLEGRNVFEIIHPDDLNRLSKEWKRILENPQLSPTVTEARVRHADGTWHIHEGTGSNLLHEPAIGRFVLNSRDVTKRKMAEKKVHESEERYRTLAETATDAIVTIDRESTILFVNPAIEKVFGYGAGELIGQRLTMLMPEYLRRVHETSLSRYIETGKKHIAWEAVELSGLHKSGKEIPLEVSFGEFKRDGAHFFTGIIRDITERKQAEEVLHEGEARYRALVEQASDALFVHDMNARFVEVNRRACESTGYSREELLQMSVMDIEMNFDLKSAQAEWVKIKEGEPFTLFGRQKRKDGSIFPVEACFGLFSLKGEKLFLVLARDITERKHAEEALRESEERFRRLSEATFEGIIIHDKGDILSVNQNLATMLDYPPKELIGRSYRDFTAPEYHAILYERATTGFEGIYEAAAVKRDGTKIPIELHGIDSKFNGRSVRVTAIRDITARKRSEEALHALERRFSIAFNANPIPSTVSALDSGRFLAANDRFVSTTGYAREEIIGHTALELNLWPHTEDRAKLMQKLKEEGRVRDFEAQMRLKNGTMRILLLSVERIELEGQQCLLHSANDITERKRSEQELQQSYEQLRSLASHLETVREEERKRIAREIHDELGQVLTAVKMDLTLLGHAALQGPIDDVRIQLQHDIKDDIELIDRSIQSVRRIATELRPEVLDELGFKSAIEWQANEFQTRTGITCLCRTDTDDIAISADASIALFRIVQEALTNISRHANATAVEIEIDRSARDLTVSIRDNGCGYSQREKPEKKTLGLLGMRERAILLGGEFTIQSSPGNGTTVTVRVPV